MQCNWTFWKETRGGQILTLPCGKCLACRKERARQWSIRLSHHLLYNQNAIFLTLTYDELNCPSVLKKEDYQLFIKRLRKRFKNIKIKYYGCGEYGSKTERPHWHIIIFGLPIGSMNLERAGFVEGRWSSAIIRELWPYGHNVTGTVNERSISYVTGYLLKEKDPKRRMQFQSQALGEEFIYDNESLIRDFKLTRYGRRVPVPRYYIKKLGILPHEIPELDSVAVEKGYEDRTEYLLDGKRIFGHVQRERNMQSAMSTKKRNI